MFLVPTLESVLQIPAKLHFEKSPIRPLVIIKSLAIINPSDESAKSLGVIGVSDRDLIVPISSPVWEMCQILVTSWPRCFLFSLITVTESGFIITVVVSILVKVTTDSLAPSTQ